MAKGERVSGFTGIEAYSTQLGTRINEKQAGNAQPQKLSPKERKIRDKKAHTSGKKKS